MRKTVLVFAAIAATCSWARADECDAVLAELAATTNGLEVGERVSSSAGNFDTVALKHPAADEIKLTCAARNSQQPNQIGVERHTAFPPASYFDLLAATGAVVTSTSTILIRKGAIACQKQALTGDVENAEVDMSGVHFKCSVFTHNGGGVAITVSSMRDINLSQKNASEDAAPQTAPTKKTPPSQKHKDQKK